MSSIARLIAVSILFASAAAARADIESDLADLSSRAAYGFYVRDGAVVAAALDALEQLPSSDGRVSYARGLAALRLAQLSEPGGKQASAMASACVAAAEEAAEKMPGSAEPSILMAACAPLAARAEPVKALLHNRRADNAIAHARSADARNPRLALVEAWRTTDDAGQLAADSAAALVSKLEAAVVAFGERAYAQPDWGEAETLALLGTLYLRKGDVRAARDVIEHALLAAPGYAHALELKRRLELHVVGARNAAP